MDTIISKIFELDPQVLMIIGIVLIVLFILSLVKKLIKLAFITIVIAAIFMFGAPALGELQENYNIKVEDSMVYVTIEGNTKEFDLDTCESISITDIEGTGNCDVAINPDSSSEVHFEVPNIMKFIIKGFANSNDIEIIE